MTCSLHCVVLLCLFGSVLSAGSFATRDQMARTPRPMQGFDISRALGKWYITYAVNPDSYRGADEFEDWYQVFRFENNVLNSVDVWRKPGVRGECSRATFVLPATSDATFDVEHSLGGASGTSGTGVLVDSDYTSWLILWGCTKPSTRSNICPDFYFHVKTRTPFPSPRTMRAIDNALSQVFGVTTADILQIRHRNPCRYPNEPDYVPMGPGGSRGPGGSGGRMGMGGPGGQMGPGGPSGAGGASGPYRNMEPAIGPYRGTSRGMKGAPLWTF